MSSSKLVSRETSVLLKEISPNFILRRSIDTVPRGTGHLLTDTEAGENFPQQIVGGVFAGNRTEGLLRQA